MSGINGLNTMRGTYSKVPYGNTVVNKNKVHYARPVDGKTHEVRGKLDSTYTFPFNEAKAISNEVPGKTNEVRGKIMQDVII